MCSVCFCVFCTAPAATENYTYCHSLSLRVALPIWKAITLAAPLHPVIDGAILMRNLHAARIERRDFCGRIIGTDDRRIILRALLQPLLVGQEDTAREKDDQRDDGEHDDGAAGGPNPHGRRPTGRADVPPGLEKAGNPAGTAR